MDLTEAERPRHGRPQKRRRQQARHQYQARHRHGHFYSQESGGQADKVHCAIGAWTRILTCLLHNPITITYCCLFTKIWATETALCAAHFRTLSATTQKFRARSRVKSARRRPTYTLSGAIDSVAGVGNSLLESASIRLNPVPRCNTAAASAALTGRWKLACTARLCPKNTGTRTAVALTWICGRSSTLRVSSHRRRSLRDTPSASNASTCGITLKAIWRPNARPLAFLPLNMATVSPASSSMAPRPLPDTA